MRNFMDNYFQGLMLNNGTMTVSELSTFISKGTILTGSSFWENLERIEFDLVDLSGASMECKCGVTLIDVMGATNEKGATLFFSSVGGGNDRTLYIYKEDRIEENALYIQNMICETLSNAKGVAVCDCSQIYAEPYASYFITESDTVVTHCETLEQLQGCFDDLNERGIKMHDGSSWGNAEGYFNDFGDACGVVTRLGNVVNIYSTAFDEYGQKVEGCVVYDYKH